VAGRNLVVAAGANGPPAAPVPTSSSQNGGPTVALDVGGPIQHHSSTLQEGVAHGAADVIRSQGMFNYLSSMAAKNYCEAQRMQIENAPMFVNAHFQCRNMNQELRAAARGRRLGAQDFARLAAAAAPPRLAVANLGANGRLHWPIQLQAEEYAQCRDELEELFLRRDRQGRLSFSEHQRIGQLTTAMLETLKDDIQSVPPVEYVAARRFPATGRVPIAGKTVCGKISWQRRATPSGSPDGEGD
jgi:hypothetical protein